MNRIAMQRRVRLVLFAGVVAVCGNATVTAQSSTLVFHTSAGFDLVSSEATGADGFPYAGLGASGNLRYLLPGDGLLSTSLLADLRYYGGELGDFQDRYTGAVDLRYPIGPVRIKTTGEVDASVRNLGDGALVIPAWSIDLFYGSSDFTPFTGYYGDYRWSETDAAHRALNGARLGMIHDYSLDFGWGAEVRGEISQFPQEFVLDESGETSSAERRDRRLDARFTADGLIGYFHSWSVDTGGGIVVSNANRLVSENDVTTVEARSEDRWISYAEGSLQLSPSRNIGIEVGIDLHHDIYTHRQYAGSPVRRTGVSGTLRADYTPNGEVFFVADTGGGWNTSADPYLEGGYLTASFRIEYSF